MRDIVIKMPHVPHGTAVMIASKLGLRTSGRMMCHPASARGLPPGDIHVIEARSMNWQSYTYRDEDMELTLMPYKTDDRYNLIYHDCDTVMGVTR